MTNTFMNNNKTSTTYPINVVEKIRAYRNKMYDEYMLTHKTLDVHDFYEEIIKNKPCQHKRIKTK